MPGGAVEVERWPSARRGAVTFVLAHGAGGSRHDPLLVELGRALRERGHAVVRFDFLYRALGRKLPDRAPILEATFQAVLARVRAERPRGSGPLIIGGKSMGGRMASRIVAAGEPASGLLLLSYPLHPAKRLSELRTEHLTRIAIPTLFVQGTRDPLCDLSLLRPALATMGPRAELFVLEAANHDLRVPKRDPGSGSEIARVVEAVSGWVAGAVAGKQRV
ncbi:MAG: alpha/beta fold hydrolase [Polyangiaceae bacterium]|nr:alpha/beta fold hydrolase [Polyangiaceae bacterium]